MRFNANTQRPQTSKKTITAFPLKELVKTDGERAEDTAVVIPVHVWLFRFVSSYRKKVYQNRIFRT